MSSLFEEITGISSDIWAETGFPCLSHHKNQCAAPRWGRLWCRHQGTWSSWHQEGCSSTISALLLQRGRCCLETGRWISALFGSFHCYLRSDPPLPSLTKVMIVLESNPWVLQCETWGCVFSPVLQPLVWPSGSQGSTVTIKWEILRNLGFLNVEGTLHLNNN